MKGFIYFVETTQAAASPKDLAGFGLGYVCHGPDSSDKLLSRQATLNGVRGLLLASASRCEPTELTIDHERQTWRRMPVLGSDAAVHCGWSGVPDPADLIRKSPLAGYPLRDARGRTWIIPRVRDVRESGLESALPRYLTLDDTGEVVAGDTVSQYAHLYDVTEEPFARIADRYEWESTPAEERAGKEPPEPTTAEYLRWLSPAIAANYAATSYELTLTGAFDSQGRCSPQVWCWLMTSALDWIQRCDAKKKTPADRSLSPNPGSTTSSGGTDGVPDIDRPAPIG